jgi:hypothetical protein
MNRLIVALPTAAVWLLCTLAPAASRAQMLETETARLLRRGQSKIEMSYEFQRSGEGTESALPFAVEYGLTNRLEILAEPVPYTAIRPKVGRHAVGPGDLEATLTYLVRREGGSVPALAVAGEVKFPTARNDLIGTGKTDYAFFAIGTKRNGRLQMHANASYTVVGKPAGASLRNVWGGALAVEFFTMPNLEFFGEALGSTASAPEGEGGDSGNPGVLVPEAASGEAVGTVGAAYRFGPRARVSLGVSYDNTHALQLRPGVAIWFR